MTTPGWPATSTPAQSRFLEEVLGWGRPRPEVPTDLLAALHAELRAAVRGATSAPAATAPAPSTHHLAALLRDDGPDSAPWRHDRATVRGILLGRAFARDLERGHDRDPEVVVTEVIGELAGERPSDPTSASAWLNAVQRPIVADLQRELAAVLADVRTLWPGLDPARVTVGVRPTLRVEAGPGPQVVTVRPDVVLSSRRQDERARSLTIVTRTGMPRPRQDRARVRATALLTALATGRVPFRWVVLHLTDGRAEVEDLDVQVLMGTARWLGERIGAQAPVPPPGGHGEGHR